MVCLRLMYGLSAPIALMMYQAHSSGERREEILQETSNSTLGYSQVSQHYAYLWRWFSRICRMEEVGRSMFPENSLQDPVRLRPHHDRCSEPRGSNDGQGIFAKSSNIMEASARYDLSSCTTTTSTTEAWRDVPEPRPEPPQDDPPDAQPESEPLSLEGEIETAERMLMSAEDYDYYGRDQEDRARAARAKKRRREAVRVFVESASSSGTRGSTTTTT